MPKGCSATPAAGGGEREERKRPGRRRFPRPVTRAAEGEEGRGIRREREFRGAVPFVVGPTAVGKTAVAVEVARRIGGEIVSADSMQVYRAIDILSSKPRPEQRRLVPHHLIGAVEAHEAFDVSTYVRMARRAIADVASRGRVPVVVGGSGMYVKALVDGIFNGPGRDSSARGRLQEEAGRKGLHYLWRRLEMVDPEAAGRIHPHDARRVIRALEVFESGGRPLSSLQREWATGDAQEGGAGSVFSGNLGRRVVLFGLDRYRGDLARRIDERVEEMFARGAVDEVRDCLDRFEWERSGLRQALGIKEIRRYIEGGCSLEEAKSELKRNTRALAKRQMTWFRGDKRIIWMHLDEFESARAVAERVIEKLRSLGEVPSVLVENDDHG